MAMKTKFINIRIRESNDGEPSCFDIDAGGSLDDILHMLCGGMDAIVTQFCAEDGDAKMRKDMLRSVAMEILSLAVLSWGCDHADKRPSALRQVQILESHAVHKPGKQDV